jgi:5-methylcytosine-specific restriction endonuclease McrA
MGKMSVNNRKIYAAVREIDKHKCVVCSSYSGIQVHHAIPRSLGGETKIENLMCLCYKCHMSIHDGSLKMIDVLEKLKNKNFRWFNALEFYKLLQFKKKGYMVRS